MAFRGAGRAGKLAWLAILAPALLSGCIPLIPQGAPVPPVPPRAPNAALVGTRLGPTPAGLGFTDSNARAALAAFATSCPRLTKRTDTSGLTRPEDWAPACAAAAGWPPEDARGFFTRYFETATVARGEALVTGYYEPEIAGVRVRQPGFDIPVYALPPDLVRARPGDAPAQPDGSQPLGRYDETGRFVPYFDRTAIENGALAGRGLEIGWVADRAELFFLQVQGSGRLRAPDGTVMRLGFAGQNGFPYTGIGSVMRAQGLIGTGPGQYPGSMQGILRYIREHPAEGAALMRQNQSYVFFRERTGPDTVGALNVPIMPRTTLAADPAFVPLGAPVWLNGAGGISGLWVAQDTGGAIKGPNRFDSFWGAGAEARTIAGGMRAQGQALILLPKGTLARLNGPGSGGM
ncbi:MltA domain-containing protein [Novosphingobium sp.]|uniref:murein transglycosylase A n=1 Tax=Novosphingobium sp. TaxID=1874826 RepID=UPI001DDAA428|nr:MltA domain-containing protein [Novosphingobium sp.]MBX9663947.1 MltA domain-containing protein [Novosphingobium sp.]